MTNSVRGQPTKGILLDRDGTIIKDKVYLNDVHQIEYYAGVIPALQELRDRGFLIFVITNQSGIARGKVTIENLHAIHAQIRADLAQHGIDIQEFYYAPYVDDSNFYRKPNPGMILQAAYEYNLNLGQCWMVGDRMLDVEAGHRAGARSALVGIQKEPSPADWTPPEIHVDQFKKLPKAIDEYLADDQPNSRQVPR